MLRPSQPRHTYSCMHSCPVQDLPHGVACQMQRKTFRSAFKQHNICAQHLCTTSMHKICAQRPTLDELKGPVMGCSPGRGIPGYTSPLFVSTKNCTARD